MKEFNYILDKIKHASFEQEPFQHLYIKNFLSEEHFSQLVSNKQIHFEECSSQEELRNKLKHYGYKPHVKIGGCFANEDVYFRALKTGKVHEKKRGMVYRLSDDNESFPTQLVKFFNSDALQHVLQSKFLIREPTRASSGIQKYLDGYSLRPHPDKRKKALTYLLNINKDDSVSNLKVHTNLYKLKGKYKAIYDYWENTPQDKRGWLLEKWCSVEKTLSENNSMIIFKPHSYSLHGVKCEYNHLPIQRTQVYGNLIFKDVPYTSFMATPPMLENLINKK